jgi:hypothetical protein
MTGEWDGHYLQLTDAQLRARVDELRVVRQRTRWEQAELTALVQYRDGVRERTGRPVAHRSRTSPAARRAFLDSLDADTTPAPDVRGGGDLNALIFEAERVVELTDADVADRYADMAAARELAPVELSSERAMSPATRRRYTDFLMATTAWERAVQSDRAARRRLYALLGTWDQATKPVFRLPEGW